MQLNKQHYYIHAQMNPVFDRECSSGCESGWTSYLDHQDSFLSPRSGDDYVKQDEHDYQEEDMSMVSDASSGPPHFLREDEYYGNDFSNNGFFIQTPTDAATLPKNNGKSKKNRESRPQRLEEQQLSFLDDTASSPIFHISNNIALSNNQDSTENNNMLDFSQAHSSTQYEGKPRFREHYGLCKSPVSGTKLQQNQLSERVFKVSLD